MTKHDSDHSPLLAGTRLKPLVAALVCIAASSASYAQSNASPTLKTVEVKGQTEAQTPSSPKFTAPLVDTPQTLQIIPEEIFTQQGAQNLTDVLANTPGISFNAGENGFSTGNSNFSLRGFDTSGSIFVDGARDSGSYSRDIFNVEQVEVAKGPAADNGRGSAGGYINLATKTPRLENFRSATISYGDDEYDSKARHRFTTDINQKVSNGAAVRLNMMVEDSGVAGRERADSNNWGVAPSVAWGPDSSTRFVLAYQHLEQESRPDWGVPAAMIKGMMRYDAVAASADRDNFYGLASDYDDTKSDSLLAKIEHDFSGTLSFSNQTRLSKTEREARFTVPTGYTPATQQMTSQTQIYDREAASFSNLSNLTALFNTGSVKHYLVAGLEFSRESSDANRYGTNNPAATSIFNPDPYRSPAFELNATQVNEVGINTQAIYIYDTMTFNDQWQLTAGLRGERYKVTIDSHNVDGSSNGAISGYKESEKTLGGKIGLVYKPASNGSIYIAAGESSLPAGSFLSNPDISRTGDNAFPGFVESANVVKSRNYEIGTKWNFLDDRLSTNIAVFHTEKRDVAITGLEEGETAATLKGYGKQIVEGVEFGISGKITEQWNVFGGFVILDSERKHSAWLDEVRKRANPADYGDNIRTSGDELAFTPKESASLWTTWQFDSGLTLGLGVQHVGDSWAGRPDDASRIIPNGTFGKLPGYTIGNAMASYTFNQNLTLRLNVNNITDELYATSTNWPANRVLLGTARSAVLSADIHF